MSTNLSDIVDQITAVLRKHRWASIPISAWGAGKYICTGCEFESVRPRSALSDHDAHVAEQIVAELGMTAVRCADERWWSTRIERGVY